MPYLRILFCLNTALPLWHRVLTAQAKPDSSSDTTPQLGGTWLPTSATSLAGARPYVVTISQIGNHLRAELSIHGGCRGSVTVAYTLGGGVDGRTVWFRLIDARTINGSVDTSLAGNCLGAIVNSQSVSHRIDFRGKLSTDGKRIFGPYDFLGDRKYIWTFAR